MPADIPQTLRDEEFEQLWALFLSYSKAEHRPIGEIQESVILLRLCRWGLGRAVDALEYTMANGWKCIREPERESNGNGNRQRPRHAAERNEQANADAFAALRSQIPDGT